jgi:hypothetical protein
MQSHHPRQGALTSRPNLFETGGRPGQARLLNPAGLCLRFNLTPYVVRQLLQLVPTWRIRGRTLVEAERFAAVAGRVLDERMACGARRVYASKCRRPARQRRPSCESFRVAYLHHPGLDERLSDLGAQTPVRCTILSFPAAGGNPAGSVVVRPARAGKGGGSWA